MAATPPVKAYPGATPAESQAMFSADAAAAAASGWVPVAQTWDGTTLIVTYGPASAPAAAPKGKGRPWLWVGAIVVGVLVVGALAGGSRDQARTTGSRPTPAPTQRPTPKPAVTATAPVVTTRTSVGDTIEIELTVRNDGTTTPDIVVGMQELSRHALFVGCVPQCDDLGESFTGQKVRLPGPQPGKSREYTITWQATSAARAQWSMWMSADDDSLDMDDPGWEATTVILL